MSLFTPIETIRKILARAKRAHTPDEPIETSCEDGLTPSLVLRERLASRMNTQVDDTSDTVDVNESGDSAHPGDCTHFGVESTQPAFYNFEHMTLDSDEVIQDEESMRLSQDDSRDPEAERSSSGGLAAAAAVGVGLAAISQPRSAHALDFSAIGDHVLDGIGEQFGELAGALMEGFGDIFSVGADRTNVAIGASADGIIDAIIATSNNDVMRDSEPPPRRCEGDRNAVDLSKEAQNAEQTAAERNRTSVTKSMNARNYSGAKQARAIRHREEYSGNGEDEGASERANADVDAGILFGTDALSDDDLLSAEDFIDNVKGDLASMAPPVDGPARETPAGALYDATRLTHNARLSLATHALHRSMEMRHVGESGRSTMQIMETEVNETYGNPEWRDEIAKKASAAPVTKEVVYQTAFQNRLLLEQIRQNELLISLTAMQLIEAMEASPRTQALIEGYAGAYDLSSTVR